MRARCCWMGGTSRTSPPRSATSGWGSRATRSFRISPCFRTLRSGSARAAWGRPSARRAPARFSRRSGWGASRAAPSTGSPAASSSAWRSRAPAFRPRILLLDEPLSALDAKLREDLRAELFSLLRALALTTVYVTHDQAEALALGDELVVMREGRIEQAGRPAEVYHRPASPFVARFLGAANLVAGDVSTRGDDLCLPFATIEAPAGSEAGPCWALLRPEDLEVVSPAEADFTAALASAGLTTSR